MIRILYTVNGMRVNGMSAVIMQYISMLDCNKYKISLFTDEIAPQFISKLQENGVDIITSKNRRRNQIEYFKELIAVLKKGKFDIVHTHGNSATIAVEMFAAKVCGVPVRIAHSHNTTCAHKVLDKILRPMLYWSYTHGIGCGIEAGRWMFGSRPHAVIKNGIDLKHYIFDEQKRFEMRKQLGIENKFVVGHIGRFTNQKNHEFLIDIFEKYSQIDERAVLLLVGDGPKEDEIKNLVQRKNLDDKVIFFGTTADTAAVYSAMDAFVFPSKFEGVPITLVEAQANGLHGLISDKISREVVQTSLLDIFTLDSKGKWVDGLRTVKKERSAEDSINAIACLTEAGFNVDVISIELDNYYNSAIIEMRSGSPKIIGGAELNRYYGSNLDFLKPAECAA